jgi:tetratricopeptide (TPR) repeat protein
MFGIRSRAAHAAHASLILLACVSLSVAVIAQSAVNTQGNGGANTIQGRLSLGSGRSDLAGLKVTLSNLEHGELTIITDNTGGFTFRNLVGGSYTVSVTGSEQFEDAQEKVYFDSIGSSVFGDPSLSSKAGATVGVNIYLRPKRRPSDGAASVVDAGLAAVPKAARDKYDAAQQDVANKRDTEAVAALREAVGIYPKFTLAWYQLGLLLSRSGDRSNAIAALRKAADADAKFTPALLALGSALVEADQYKEAETYLAAALAADPSLYSAHYYLGIAEIKLNRLDIGEKALLKAVEIGGDKVPRAHYYLGGIYWANKQYSKAADQLEKYLQSDPKAADAEKVKRSIAELRSKT